MRRPLLKVRARVHRPHATARARFPTAGTGTTGRCAFGAPLVESYPSAVVLVLLALCPYLALTTASLPLEPLVHRDVGVSETGLALTAGLANAAYSFGCVLAAQLAQKLRGRRLLLLYALLFVVGSVLAAWAPSPAPYVAGRIVQGLTTGLMLIAAVPPLVLGWPTSKLPRTAVVMNMGIFGARRSAR